MAPFYVISPDATTENTHQSPQHTNQSNVTVKIASTRLKDVPTGITYHFETDVLYMIPHSVDRMSRQGMYFNSSQRQKPLHRQDVPTENALQFIPTSNAPPSTGCPDRDIRKLIAVCIRAWKARDAYGTIIPFWRCLKDILLCTFRMYTPPYH